MDPDEFSLDNRHKLARPYWARPSFRLAKGAGAGGSSRERDDDDDEEDDDPDDDDDEEDDDPDDELDEDELRDQLKEVRAALKTANGQGKSRRLKLTKRIRDLERDLADARKPKPGKPKSDDNGASGHSDDELEAAKAGAKTEAEQAANERIKRAEARGALRAAGVKGDLLSKAVRHLELDDLEVDDDGEVDGIDDAIADLRKSMPSLFGGKAPAKRRSVAGPSDRDGERGPKPRKMTTSEIQAKQIKGEL